MDPDHNRSVITLAGEPAAAEEAAFRGIRTAARLIDLDTHRGEHPRIGATDVVPFVPIRGVSMEDCVAMARRLGQPQVVGEMVAGVFLGPSLLGLAFPGIQQALFPPESLKVLYVGAQLGVGLYMFLVGVEFQTELFRSRVRSAASVSIAGMFVPFACAVALAPWLKNVPGLFPDRTNLFQAILFLGAAMAITAFPMLARIIYERGLTGTPLGTLALAAGAIGDAGAWCVMAIVLASFGAGPAVAIKAIGGGLLYALVVLTVGRLLFKRLGAACERAGGLTPGLLAITLTLFMLGAWITDAIGVHAVFGGFLMGIAMPRGKFASELRRQLA